MRRTYDNSLRPVEIMTMRVAKYTASIIAMIKYSQNHIERFMRLIISQNHVIEKTRAQKYIKITLRVINIRVGTYIYGMPPQILMLYYVVQTIMHVDQYHDIRLIEMLPIIRPNQA